MMTSNLKYVNKLAGTKALVIGGTSGIGYAVAEALVEHGAVVAISSSNTTRVESACTKLKAAYPDASNRILGFTCDLSDQENVEAGIRTLFEQVGKLDHVVFTAGDALSMTSVQDFSIEAMRKAGQVRFFAPLLIAKHAASYITRSTKASITFTGGVTSDRPIPGWSLVSGFAAGLEGAARGLAIDLKPVRVNVVRPGVVDTNLYATSGIPDQIKQGIFAESSQKLPVGKVGRPEDLAEAYLYLMKDENVTGELVNSSGGQLLV